MKKHYKIRVVKDIELQEDFEVEALDLAEAKEIALQRDSDEGWLNGRLNNIFRKTKTLEDPDDVA